MKDIIIVYEASRTYELVFYGAAHEFTTHVTGTWEEVRVETHCLLNEYNFKKVDIIESFTGEVLCQLEVQE